MASSAVILKEIEKFNPKKKVSNTAAPYISAYKNSGTSQTASIGKYLENIKSGNEYKANDSFKKIYSDYKKEYRALGDAAAANTEAFADSLDAGYGNDYVADVVGEMNEQYRQDVGDNLSGLMTAAVQAYENDKNVDYNAIGVLQNDREASANRQYNAAQIAQSNDNYINASEAKANDFNLNNLTNELSLALSAEKAAKSARSSRGSKSSGSSDSWSFSDSSGEKSSKGTSKGKTESNEYYKLYQEAEKNIKKLGSKITVLTPTEYGARGKEMSKYADYLLDILKKVEKSKQINDRDNRVRAAYAKRPASQKR